MAAPQPLIVLNKSSARVATFGVRTCGGRVVQYTYTSKKDQSTVAAHKFEAWLVGGNPQDYCIGFVKGTQTECERAKTKYHDDAVWKLAKASMDTYTATAYISTPIQFRVDLAKSTMTILDAQDGIGKRLRGSIPKKYGASAVSGRRGSHHDEPID